MNSRVSRLGLALLLTCAKCAFASDLLEAYGRTINSLISPRSLPMGGGSGRMHTRLQQAVAWLHEGRQQDLEVDLVIEDALRRAAISGRAGELTKAALLRNLKVAQELGVLDSAGLADMKMGRPTTIRRGPYQGDDLAVDHIIPVAVAPELGPLIANLELLPARMNAAKRGKVGERQVDLARKFRAAGLLSEQGLQAVLKAAHVPGIK